MNHSTLISKKIWKIGILGTASVARYALIAPAQSRIDCQVRAVASRDLSRASAYAQKNKIPVAYGSYEELLRDRDLDVIYVALPNHLHAHWSIQAMQAGKHVLCEKPMASNAEEGQEMLQVSKQTGKLLMEALHSTHHPLYPKMREILASGELGRVKSMKVNFCSLLPFRNNIRFQYDLAGGANMDIGCYSIQLIRYLLGEKLMVDSAAAIEVAPEVDGRMDAKMHTASGVQIDMACSLIEKPWNIRMSIRIEGEKGSLHSINPFAAHLFHTLSITSLDGKKRKIRVSRSPTSYSHQLQKFIDLITAQSSETPSSAEEAIQTLSVMDAVYQKAGLKIRGQKKSPQTLLRPELTV